MAHPQKTMFLYSKLERKNQESENIAYSVLILFHSCYVMHMFFKVEFKVIPSILQ